MCTMSSKDRLKLVTLVLDESGGKNHYMVVLKKGFLSQAEEEGMFGLCVGCPLNDGQKFEVAVKNPLDPSIKPRVNCSAMNGQWVKPMKQGTNPDDCSRRTHVSAKKMARPHGYAEHAMARATAASTAK